MKETIYRVITYVDPKTLATINEYLSASREEDYQDEDDTISVTAVFPDGCQMDIKCCGSQDESSWTEAVLFDKQGRELCFSEPADEFDGEWELEFDGKTYIAIVAEGVGLC